MYKTHKAYGKVVLFGEYGVLLGYKALVASIDRFALCSFKASSKMLFTGIAKNNVITNSFIFDAALKACADFKINIPCGEYIVDTSEFFTDDNKKLGIGSSSAALSALCKSIIYHGNNHHITALTLALRVNFYLTNGFGSGIDIMAAFSYGINQINPKNIEKYHNISYKKSENFLSNIFIVYTGKQQSTNEFTKLFWQKNNTQIKKILKTNYILYKNIFANKNYKKENIIIDIINRIDSNMNELQNICSFKIITQKHLEISEIAKNCQGAAKISGAGGGDISLTYIPKSYQERFIKLVNNIGCLLIKI